ncbi:metal ABC transporter solute-binding protein, Zn/Mn family [Fructilactobacillus frigidiflavus]|uniref:metal ABC transporter solute-binding protein, Zn/Mn family n=1 Tax=Fructilactobacillus frigidiflavus TaxID=3242688 RepID=UPI003757B04F
MKKIIKVSSVLFSFITIALFLTGCKSQSSQKSDKINVVATTNFYAEPAKAVLGDHGKVEFIVKPGVDPHEFTPKNSDAAIANKATVVVENGLGYDEWMNKLDSNNGNDPKVINVGKLMDKKNGDNEHIWYDPATMSKLADKLAETYGKIQPKHKKEFEKNAADYKNKMKKNQALVKELATKSNHQKVAVSEPVFNYSLEAMGYKVTDPGFANAIEKDVDPSPKDLVKVRDDIKGHKIAFFVENTQTENKTVTDLAELAKKNNVPVVKVTETVPAGTNYFDWMNSQYEQVKKIQDNQ